MENIIDVNVFDSEESKLLITKLKQQASKISDLQDENTSFQNKISSLRQQLKYHYKINKKLKNSHIDILKYLSFIRAPGINKYIKRLQDEIDNVNQQVNVEKNKVNIPEDTSENYLDDYYTVIEKEPIIKSNLQDIVLEK